MRYYLWKKFDIKGEEINGEHDLPDDFTNAWTIVRHPATWILSYYHYLAENQWRWEDRPEFVADLFRYADGLFWPQYVDAICSQPGVIGKMFDYYCIDGVQLFQLEKIDLIFSEPVPALHAAEHKPLYTLDQWQMICDAEDTTLAEYHYDDVPPEYVRKD